jgi:thioredoxin 1
MQRAVLVQVVIGLLIGGSLGALLGYFGKCSTGTCPLTANPYRGALIGSILGGLLVFSGVSSRPNDEGNEPGHTAVSVESEADFDQFVLKANRPVLVDFYSNGCPPCRRLAPVVETLAEDYDGRASVCKVNVDHVPTLAQRYGVRGIPAVLFFKDGQETQRLVGLQPRDTYADVLDKLID